MRYKIRPGHHRCPRCGEWQDDPAVYKCLECGEELFDCCIAGSNTKCFQCEEKDNDKC